MPADLLVYGLNNCDTCRKARKWLEAEGINFEFHDLRKDGISRQTIDQLLREVGAEKLINRRGTTWRQLDEAAKTTEGEALGDLVTEYPALMKRPIFLTTDRSFVGFDKTAQDILQNL